MTTHPALTPFTSIRTFVDELQANQDHVAQVDTAMRFAGHTAMFDRLVLYTLARMWMSLLLDENGLEDGCLFSLEEKWDGASVSQFLQAVRDMLGKNSAANCRILGEVAMFLTLKEKYPKLPIQKAVEKFQVALSAPALRAALELPPD